MEMDHNDVCVAVDGAPAHTEVQAPTEEIL